MHMASEISVIICAYTEKRWDDLVAAVESVQRQTLSSKEIVVVIDHNPALLRRVQENLSGVIAIENGGDKGLSGARNSGWSTAQGEIVAFLDDDAIAEPDWLENLVERYADPDVVGAGGKIVPLWETSRPIWFPEEFNWVIGSTYRGMPSKNARIRNVIGANMSMRRDILAAVGGFRESFGCDKDANTSRGTLKWFNHYAGDEETEFCIRVSQQLPGSVWLYAASAVVQHRVSAERTRWAYFLWRCYDEGLGKASLVKLHDASTGLSSERAYTFKVLPRGVVRGLADTFLRFKPAGVFCAGAIVTGLGMTTVGYLIGSISSRITDHLGAHLAGVSHHRTAEVPRPLEVQ
jgi:glycosyltransferase involved in cell wall biosynthesis